MDGEAIEYAAGKMLAAVHDGVGTITFNQPEKRNAMSVEMWDGLTDILSAWEEDDAVRVVILTGAGDKAFVSGADISQFEKSRSNADAQKEYDKVTSAGRAKLAGYGKPVIARIQGFCLGGGLGIAMGADLRIAGESSKFGIPAAKLGIAYGWDMVRRLISLVGHAHARMMLFTGERMDAREAERIGLVNRVVPDAELDAVGGGDRPRDGRQCAALHQGDEVHLEPGAEGPGGSRYGRCAAGGLHLLRQCRLHRRPDRVHGEAQAALPGEVGRPAGRPLS